jgi:hypothetical protein
MVPVRHRTTIKLLVNAIILWIVPVAIMANRFYYLRVLSGFAWKR